MDKTHLDLYGITRSMSGVVIYGREALVCNWASIDGLPRLDPMGVRVIGLGEEIPEVEGRDATGPEIAAILGGVRIIYSDAPAGDIDDLFRGRCPGKVYSFPEFGAIVIAPCGWN